MIQALGPYLPLLLLGGAAVAFLVDRWLQRPTFPLEAFIGSATWISVMYGVVGVLSGNPVNEQTGGLPLPLVWVGRIGTGIVYLGIAFGILRLPRGGPGRSLLLGLVTFCGFTLAAQVANGGPVHDVLILTPLAAYVLWRSAGTTPDQATRIVTLGLWAVTIGALVLALTPFGWSEYGGSLIGIDVRLTGVKSHANGMGPYFVYLIWMTALRRPSGIMAWIEWGVPILALIATQSKTSWAAAVLGAALIWWYRVGRLQVRRHRALPIAVALVSVLVVGLIATEAPRDLVSPEEAEELTTLTGRTNIWQIGVDEFVEHPIAGAGSDVYLRFAERTGQEWAGQAHNQFINTAAGGGLLSVVGLMVYLVLLVRYAIRLAPVSSGVSLAVVATFLVRWLTESPAAELSFEQMTVLALLFAWSRVTPGDSTTAVGGPTRADMREVTA